MAVVYNQQIVSTEAERIGQIIYINEEKNRTSDVTGMDSDSS